MEKITENIWEKLLYIQSSLKAPKNQYNKFGNYFYRSCEDIQDALKPLLAEKECVLVLGDSLELAGSNYYIRATAILIDCKTGTKIENTAYAKEDATVKGMSSAQVTGSTSSYARKYALNGLFCISDEKDGDTDELNEEQNKRKEKALEAEKKYKEPVSVKQISELRGIFREMGIDEAKVLVTCKAEAMESLSYAQYLNIIQHKEAVKSTCSI